MSSILDEYRSASPEFVEYVLREFPWASWKMLEKLWYLYQMKGQET